MILNNSSPDDIATRTMPHAPKLPSIISQRDAGYNVPFRGLGILASGGQTQITSRILSACIGVVEVPTLGWLSALRLVSGVHKGAGGGLVVYSLLGLRGRKKDGALGSSL